MRRLIPARAGKTYRGRTGVRPFTAHPRMGGENLCSSVAVVGVEGSSPHGRGKHLGVIPGQAGHRLIPAWAGKTCRKLRRERAAAAHPRAGGENSTVERLSLSYSGSSPRGRGKPHRSRRFELHAGLIPAQAGKTKGRLPYAAVRQAHPRAGGENLRAISSNLSGSGSSPRRRGKRQLCFQPFPHSGLIPAQAGKTTGRLVRRLGRQAHPRAGGENDLFLVSKEDTPGSSPRRRGKLEVWSEGSLRWRLIPAQAGKTGTVACCNGWAGAHPRAGGENELRFLHGYAHQGSSPRRRGKLAQGHGPHHRGRLIPAQAGKTRDASAPLLRYRAHPRAGGENCGTRIRLSLSNGSSPRRRGKPAW